MDSSSRATSSRTRGTLLTLLGVVAALAIVAVASRGETPIGREGTRRPADLLLDTLLSLFVILMLIGVALFVYLIYLRKDALAHYRSTGKRQRSTVRSLLILSAFLVAIFLIVRLRADNGTGIRIPTLEPPPEAGEGSGAGSDDGRYEPQFAWIPMLVISALALGGVGAAWWSANARKRARGGDEASLAEALSDVIDESLDDLRAEQDPRLAVIRAYARLERALAAYGLPRRPAEAPLEYLGRMLEELSISRVAVRRLTLLFERAKFSQHEVEEPMKERAIAALQQVQEELRTAELAAELERAAAVEAARERAALWSRTAEARRLAPLPVLATIGVVAVIAFVPGRTDLALHVYLLVLATLALGWLVTVLRRAHPPANRSPFDLGLRVHDRRFQSLPELARLEREVTLATTTAFDVHFRLRPVLRRISERTLQARRGVELDRNPAAAEQLLGSELWELVRPDREPPADRGGPGLDLRSLGRMIAALEQL